MSNMKQIATEAHDILQNIRSGSTLFGITNSDPAYVLAVFSEIVRQLAQETNDFPANDRTAL